MKSVMISINPKWCELIASGQKTVEVRKTKPKLKAPFKCYIYCTKDYNKDNFLNGKVIGEFVCDFIYENISYDSKETCVSVDDMKKYANGKPLYGWHISDLVIYDRPKELSEFNKPCTDPFQYCQGCEHGLIQLQKPPQSWCYVEEARV